MVEKKKPVFEKRIFWDVNFESIDYDAKANWVIARVFERGDVEDIRQCRRYYGDEKVTEALLNAKYLPLHTIHFASAIIDKPLNDFKCYTLRQLNPGLFHWLEALLWHSGLGIGVPLTWIYFFMKNLIILKLSKCWRQHLDTGLFININLQFLVFFVSLMI
jgi:hypothetical protein